MRPLSHSPIGRIICSRRFSEDQIVVFEKIALGSRNVLKGMPPSSYEGSRWKDKSKKW